MITVPFEVYKKRLTDKVPELREIEIYLDQYNTKDKTVLLYALPAVFIEFPIMATRDMSARIQSSEANIRFHLVTECILDNQGRIKKENPLDHMVLVDKLYRALSGFSSKLSFLPQHAELAGTNQDQTVMNSNTRVDIVTPARLEGPKMVSIQTFKTILYDHAASKSYTKVTLPVDVKPEISIP